MGWGASCLLSIQQRPHSINWSIDCSRCVRQNARWRLSCYLQKERMTLIWGSGVLDNNNFSNVCEHLGYWGCVALNEEHLILLIALRAPCLGMDHLQPHTPSWKAAHLMDHPWYVGAVWLRRSWEPFRCGTTAIVTAHVCIWGAFRYQESSGTIGISSQKQVTIYWGWRLPFMYDTYYYHVHTGTSRYTAWMRISVG